MSFRPFDSVIAYERDAGNEVKLTITDGADAVYFELATRNIDGRVHHSATQMINVNNWDVIRQIHDRLGNAIASHDRGERG